jgi:T5orf172 domain-containing protein
MANNKADTTNHAVFVVGKKYTRADVADLIDYPDHLRSGGAWMTGMTEFDGAFYIFANIGLAGRTGHDYPNRWRGKDLVLTGRTGSKRGQPQLERLLSGEFPVHVFWRSANNAAFTYAGEARAIETNNASPVEIVWTFDKALSGQTLPGTQSQAYPSWRRGPPPSHGARSLAIKDGPAHLYVMQLVGVTPEMVEGASETDSVIKIGMSKDPARRLREMNGGFPPGLSVQWQLIRTIEFESGDAAFAAETKVLEALRIGEQWIGGEFAIVDVAAFSTLLNDAR